MTPDVPFLDSLNGCVDACNAAGISTQCAVQVSTVYSVAIGKPHFGNVSTNRSNSRLCLASQVSKTQAPASVNACL